MKGVVTRIFRNIEGRKDKGGYFFIRGEDGKDRFAHANDIGQSAFSKLKDDAAVEFTPTEGGPRGNGLRAEDVRTA